SQFLYGAHSASAPHQPGQGAIRMPAMLMTIQLTLGFLLTLPVPFSYAHEWYSNECCSDRDCHPVADGVVKELAEVVTRCPQPYLCQQHQHIAVLRVPHFQSLLKFVSATIARKGNQLK